MSEVKFDPFARDDRVGQLSANDVQKLSSTANHYDEETELYLARNPHVTKFLYHKYIDKNPVIGLYQMVSELARKSKK